MTQKEFVTDLTGDDRLRFRFKTSQGKVVDFVVQYETRMGAEYRPVVRYDCHHGHAHRDILDRQGNVIDKRWMPAHYTRGQAFDEAERDLRANWQAYQDRFVGRKR